MRKFDGINKSSTETKLDKYFDEGKPKSCRKFSEITYKVPFPSDNSPSDNSINKVNEPIPPFISLAEARRRKGSTISNLSNLDFHGSGLHIHAVNLSKNSYI